MAVDLSRFKETFFQEAYEHLAEMEASLLRLEASTDDPELLNSIFRNAHSIKGGSGTFGLEAIAKFTHELESLLDTLRNGTITADHELVGLLLRSVDVLREMLDHEQAGDGAHEPTALEGILSNLAAYRSGNPVARTSLPEQTAASEDSRHRYHISFEPHINLFQLGLDPLLVLRDLAQLPGTLRVTADISQLPPLTQLNPLECHMKWQAQLETDLPPDEIRDVFAFVEDVASVKIEAEAQVQAATAQPETAAASIRSSGATSIRVATGKVDKIIDMVGELVIAQSMATEIARDFTSGRIVELQAAIAELERHTRELQDRVMSIRMLPIGSVFSRFPRLVRDTAATLGKDVALQVSGEETELDKGLVEGLADPLMHLIRNAVDHGIEPVQQRTLAGKPAQGTIHLAARHQGGNVIVEVSDDGRGLDRERIRQKAIERGLIQTGDELSDEQTYALVFAAGFSTASAVSDISGRGVGMDVVRKNVEALSGTVMLASQPGRGTTVRIKLPLTLAILDGLSLRVGNQTYILPLAAISESIQPRPEQVKTVAGQGEVVMVRQEPLPILRLHEVFGIEGAVSDPSRALVVIVEHEGRRLALLVDEILGQQQVVIKSLEANFRKVEGILGATILGDGHAALILDVSGMVQISKAACARPQGEAA